MPNDLKDSKSENQKREFVFALNKDFTPNAFNQRDVNSSTDEVFKFKTENTQNSSGFTFANF